MRQTCLKRVEKSYEKGDDSRSAIRFLLYHSACSLLGCLRELKTSVSRSRVCYALAWDDSDAYLGRSDAHVATISQASCFRDVVGSVSFLSSWTGVGYPGFLRLEEQADTVKGE
jgi:hypothetical protein